LFGEFHPVTSLSCVVLKKKSLSSVVGSTKFFSNSKDIKDFRKIKLRQNYTIHLLI